jgi:hypothetical protein
LVAGVVFVDGSKMGKGDPAAAVIAVRNAIEKIGFQDNARRSFAGMFFGDDEVALKNRIIARAVRLDPQFGIRARSSFPGWDAASN